MGLLQLATEILIEILLYLDVPDAYVIQSVNHFLNNIYKVSLELQYALECTVAHVRDNPNCHLPIGDRLRMLRDREAAWRSLEPTYKRTISPIPKFTPYFDFSDVSPVIQRDHYLLFDSSSSTIISLFHDNTFHSSFEMEDMKHICCCIEEHDVIACLAWWAKIHIRKDCRSHKFFHSPYISYNSMEIQIKLIQHSTGTAHPLAKNPTIVLCNALVDTVRTEDCAMEVFGENLVLTIHLENNEWLYVYDWMTGVAKCVSLLQLRLIKSIPSRSELANKKPLRLSYAAGNIVLDENLILIPDFATWSLHIYHIPPSSTGGAVKLICQLCLPALYYPVIHTNFSWVKCRSAPNPTSNDKFPKHVPSSVPFIDDPKTALIQVIWDLWHYETLGSENGYISLVVHRHSIIDALPPSNHWSTVTTPDIIDWEMWGPNVTHWSSLPRSEFPSFNNILHGQRIILPISSYSTNHAGAALIKDFNRYRASRDQVEKKYDDFEHLMLKSDPIKNTLPYCENYLPVRYKCNDYSITDGLIVGFNRTKMPADESTIRSLEMMYFGR